MNKEQIEILKHTLKVQFYCGDSKDMKILCDYGLMESAGRKSFVPDEYFKITERGKNYLNAQSTKGRYD